MPTPDTPSSIDIPTEHCLEVRPDVNLYIWRLVMEARLSDDPLNVVLTTLAELEEYLKRDDQKEVPDAQVQSTLMAANVLENMLGAGVGEPDMNGRRRHRYPFVLEDPVHAEADRILEKQLEPFIDTTAHSESIKRFRIGELGGVIVVRETLLHDFEPGTKWEHLNGTPRAIEYMLTRDEQD